MATLEPSHNSLCAEDLLTVETTYANFREHTVPNLSLSFNVFTRSKPELYGIVLGIFTHLGALSVLAVTPTALLDFIIDVDKGYLDNAYHNFYHGVDVLFVVYYILHHMEVSRFLDQIQLTALAIASLCHDVGHPGLNNVYQVNADTELARSYGDSILERYSISITYSLLEKHQLLNNINTSALQAPRAKSCRTSAQLDETILEEVDTEVGLQEGKPSDLATKPSQHWYSNVETAEWSGGSEQGRGDEATSIQEEIRYLIGEEILSTDMQYHFELLEAFTEITETIAQRSNENTGDGNRWDLEESEPNAPFSAGPDRSTSEPSGSRDVNETPPLNNVTRRSTSLTRDTNDNDPPTSARRSTISGSTGFHDSIAERDNHHPGVSSASSCGSSYSVTSATNSSHNLTGNFYQTRNYSQNQLPAISLDRDQRLTLCKMLLHAADISNTARPWCLCKRWSDAVVEEFFRQGDLEKKNGLAISPNMDRDVSDQTQISLNFGDLLVKPMFAVLANFIPEGTIFLDTLAANRAHWFTKPILEAEPTAGNNYLFECVQNTERLPPPGRRVSIAAGTITIPDDLHERLKRYNLEGRKISRSLSGGGSREPSFKDLNRFRDFGGGGGKSLERIDSDGESMESVKWSLYNSSAGSLSTTRGLAGTLSNTSIPLSSLPRLGDNSKQYREVFHNVPGASSASHLANATSTSEKCVFASAAASQPRRSSSLDATAGIRIYSSLERVEMGILKSNSRALFLGSSQERTTINSSSRETAQISGSLDAGDNCDVEKIASRSSEKEDEMDEKEEMTERKEDK